jgi:site-specific DNA-methyltransferase (adenine-specific)
VEAALNTIHHGDCIAGLRRLASSTVDLAFADPPFNIGYEYDVYDDNQSYHSYLEWTRQWIAEVCRVLKPTGTFWVAIGDEYAAEVKLLAQNELHLACRSWVIWYYTFGVNCRKKFNRSHAHLFHFVKDANRYTFNEDEISVPSARELVYADGRAHPTGRLPDDTWILRPQDVPNGFTADQSTWYFPRVAGTFKERMGFHGCQMPEQLLGRIIRTCSNPAEVVLDPFAGSGTTLAVAKKLGRKWIGFELSKEYTQQATTRINRVFVGQPLEGAPEPVVSAPKTPGKSSKVWLRSSFHRAIIEAFAAACDGWSSDRVIADPKLNERFCKECRRVGLLGSAVDWNRALMRLRKARKLKGLPKPRRTTFPEQQLDQYLFASEIAMRNRMDESGLSMDAILCDPEQARLFDEIARSFAPGFSSLHYRWAALTIRKRAHNCRKWSQGLDTKLERRRYGNFCRLRTFDLASLIGSAGVYLARRPANEYLYVGETYDLGKRFKQHLDAEAWGRIADDAEIGVIELPGIQPKARCGLQSRHIGNYEPKLNYLDLAGI